MLLPPPANATTSLVTTEVGFFTLQDLKVDKQSLTDLASIFAFIFLKPRGVIGSRRIRLTE